MGGSQSHRQYIPLKKIELKFILYLGVRDVRYALDSL
jgi:hypothetical protein